MGEIYNPEHWFFKQRNGKKAIYLDKELVDKINQYAEQKGKCPVAICEYILRTGINTVEHYPQKEITFDVDKL